MMSHSKVYNITNKQKTKTKCLTSVQTPGRLSKGPLTATEFFV